MLDQKRLTRRRVLQSTGAAAGYLLVKPAISLAHQAGPDGLTIYAAAAAQDDEAIVVLARDIDEGFQLRELTVEQESIVQNEVIENYFPDDFWPLDLGLADGTASSVVGSVTEFVPGAGESSALVRSADASRSELPEEPYGPFALAHPTVHEIERPAVWIDHDVNVMDGRGIVAARVEEHYRTVEVVLSPVYDDGDHLSEATAIIDGDSYPLPLADEQPLGSAAAFVKADGAVIIAVDMVPGNLTVFELQPGDPEWQRFAPLRSTVPGSAMMSDGATLTASRRRANGAARRVMLDTDRWTGDPAEWRYSLQSNSLPVERVTTPASAIPVKGRAAWLVRSKAGQLELRQ